MVDRQFNEVDLRTMMTRAKSCQPDIVKGRWVIGTRHHRHPWEVIVEPDGLLKILVVVTAYPIWTAP